MVRTHDVPNEPPSDHRGPLRRAEVDGLAGGRIIRFMPAGFRPKEVASNILIALREQPKRFGGGWACNENLGFVVPELSSGRESFCPNAVDVVGPRPRIRRGSWMVRRPSPSRSAAKEDDGPADEAEMASTRADDHEAGTLVVWDVGPVAPTVASRRARSHGRRDARIAGLANAG
jgi:hypothetical protein